MDKSVHPPVFGAEAVHSCAASVAIVLGLVSMEECLFSDCTNAFTFSRFEDLVAVPHV